MVSYEEAYLSRIAALEWNDPCILVPHFREVFSDGASVALTGRLDHHSRLELILLEHWPSSVDIFSLSEAKKQQAEMRKRNNQVTLAFWYKSPPSKKPLEGYETFTLVVDKVFAAMEERDTDASYTSSLVKRLKEAKDDEERDKVQVDFKPLAVIFDNEILGRSNYGIVLSLGPDKADVVQQISALYGWSYADIRYMDFSGFGISENPADVNPPDFRLPGYSYREQTRSQLYGAFTARIESIFSSLRLCVEDVQTGFFGEPKDVKQRNIGIVYEHNGKIRLMAVSLMDNQVFISGYIPKFVYAKLSEDLVRKIDDATL